jgi:hypothetical protein
MRVLLSRFATGRPDSVSSLMRCWPESTRYLLPEKVAQTNYRSITKQRNSITRASQVITLLPLTEMPVLRHLIIKSTLQ